jgi:hypothetical protein
MTKDEEVSATMAEAQTLDAMVAPFRLAIEELEEKINRSERDGICPVRTAKAAREELVDLHEKLSILIVRKILIGGRIKDENEKASQ